MLSQTAINTGSNFSLQAVEFTYMLVIDLMFLVALVVLMLPLGIWRQAAFAVMKRNFVGYFSNPTGYVFLCLFVLLTSFAAFWPHEFFTTNLANFDQLNKFLPYIMLVFIPAITMSIWAEERRQGTDELLLTLPAKDFDIVIGKYFAAVLVFTVSLLFSQLSNYTVLLSMTGGELDNLMLFSTYLGYWFMGIAMISVGMVASFLTNNLTVGFIFGAAFNAPLAFFSNADVIFSDSLWVQRLFDWSLLQRFEPFGRGLISVSSIVYFLGIVVIGVYLSLILIGRRHWLGGRDGTSMVWHYAVRAILVAIIAISTVLVVQHSPINQARVDISDAQINTLAPETLSLLEELKNDTSDDAQPVNIEAFVSNNIPSEFVRMKYDLLNLLREFDALGGKRVNVQLHQGIGPFSQIAIQAEKKYGIRPVKFRSEQRGAVREEEIVLGIALSCGIERIVLPFLNYGVPIEYELMQSVSAVAKPSKKRIGVVETDILPFGGPIRTQEETIQIRKLRFLTELQKQYEVERVDASSPITLFEEDADGKILRRRYDALMVIQPSASTKSELKNVIDAIRMGQPTLILEDPLPTPQNFAQIRGTLMPRVLPRGEPEQADIKSLWNVLGMDVDLQRRGNATQSALFPNVLWHLPAQNPYKRSQILNQPPQLIIAQDSPSDPRFSQEHPATRDITELYFQFAGYFRKNPKSDLNYVELVNSGRAGTVSTLDVMQSQSAQQLGERLGLPNRQEMIAAAIQGEKANEPLPEKSTDLQKDQDNINVIYIADVDTLSDTYLAVRDAPVINGVEYRYQNVSFLMNAIDSLTNVEDFMNLRNRRFRHVTLEKIEETYNEAMEEVFKLDEELGIEYQNRLNQARDEILKATKPLEERIRRATAARDANKKYDARRLKAEEALLAQRRREQATKFQNTQQELENERQERKRDIELKAEMKIQKTQRDFKLAAVVIPPIPPLLVGLFVFARRRLREREGISKARRLK